MLKWRLAVRHLHRYAHRNFHGTEDERQLKTMWLTLRQRAPSGAVGPAPDVVRKEMVEDRVEPAAPKCCCDAPGCCGAAAPAPSANKDKKDALTKVANRGERAKTALTRKEMVEKMAKLLGIEVK